VAGGWSGPGVGWTPLSEISMWREDKALDQRDSQLRRNENYDSLLTPPLSHTVNGLNNCCARDHCVTACDTTHWVLVCSSTTTTTHSSHTGKVPPPHWEALKTSSHTAALSSLILSQKKKQPLHKTLRYKAVQPCLPHTLAMRQTWTTSSRP